MLPDGIRSVYASDGCEIDLARRELRVSGLPIPVGGRAFEIIEVLVQSAGELVSKDELMSRIWPGAVVMDNTIQVHTAAIRKALGPYRSLLKTEARRGYRLLGSWTVRHQGATRQPSGLQRIKANDGPPRNNLPVAAAGLVGARRAGVQVTYLVSAYRLVTLTGPGGIGKTSLALEVARLAHSDFADGGWLVELASLTNPQLVPATVAGVLGLRLASDIITAETVAGILGGKKLLLVLDNCEHVIESAATLAETFTRLCPNITVMATSREDFRVQGEFVYRVPPLEVPALHEVEATQILGHSAPQLFVARTKELGTDYSSDAKILPMIGAICRQLDGIPLAIEFAAARAATLGIEQVAAGLRDRFALLTSGRRTALARHRTLRATLDWSYDLLSEREQRLLCRFGVFAGGFTFEAASLVGEDAGNTDSSLTEALADLVAKSLVAFDASAPQGRWRLLETIRAYVNEKLVVGGEAAMVGRRHAEYFRDFFALLAESATPSDQDIARYARDMDNARAALDWAYSPEGSPELAVSLTVGIAPLWMHLSLLDECRVAVTRALATMAATRNGDLRVEMRLHAALGASLAWVGGAFPEIEAAWERTLWLAETLGDVDHQLRSLWGLWLLKDREALALARQFSSVAVTPADRLLGDRMLGVSHHYLGNQMIARRYIERVIADGVIRESGSRIIRFQIDHRLGAQAFHARILWLIGFPEQAISVAEDLVEHARGIDHANSLCHATAIAACPIALWTGNLDRCESHVALLRDYAGRHTLVLWRAFGRAHQGVLLIKRGDIEAGLPLLRAGLDEFGPAFAGYRVLMFLIELAETLGRVGQVSEGNVIIDEAIDRAERTAEQWIIPELLRVRAELLLLQAAPGASAAADMLFQQAINCARGQGALSWELRSAMSLARFRATQGREGEARRILLPVYERFTEGFATADLRAARLMIDAMPP